MKPPDHCFRIQTSGILSSTMSWTRSHFCNSFIDRKQLITEINYRSESICYVNIPRRHLHVEYDTLIDYTPLTEFSEGFFYQFHHPTLYARMVSLSLSSAIAFFISLYLTFCQSLSHLNRRLSLISCSRAIRATEAPSCKTSLTIWSLTHLKMICGVLRIMFLLHNRRPPVWWSAPQ